MLAYKTEKRLLQVMVLAGACVPLTAGLSGMILGPKLLGDQVGLPLDSHMRYLSGLLFGLGLGFLSVIPRIERSTRQVRMMAVPSDGPRYRHGTRRDPIAMSLAGPYRTAVQAAAIYHAINLP